MHATNVHGCPTIFKALSLKHNLQKGGPDCSGSGRRVLRLTVMPDVPAAAADDDDLRLYSQPDDLEDLLLLI